MKYCRMSAAAPAVMGVAMEVPDISEGGKGREKEREGGDGRVDRGRRPVGGQSALTCGQERGKAQAAHSTVHAGPQQAWLGGLRVTLHEDWLETRLLFADQMPSPGREKREGGAVRGGRREGERGVVKEDRRDGEGERVREGMPGLVRG